MRGSRKVGRKYRRTMCQRDTISRHRCTGHDVPRGPHMPQIVPAEIPDAGALECIPPGPRVSLP
jgi:hypothetical protein